MGNRTSQTAPNGTTPYAYDANNRLTTAGAVTYYYDANGNLTSTTAGQSFSWDVFNRLTGASGSGGSVSYTYNGDGLKLRRTGPDGATVYYYDGIRPIWEADGAGTPRVQMDRDIFGNLLGRREVSSGVRRYFAHDGLGGMTGATDEAGGHVASLFYDAWGNVRAAGGTWTAGYYQFTGAELDPVTGLYHMGMRFYDPVIGRWLSEDLVQITSPRTLNFYTYVANNPLGHTDLSGLCDQLCLEDLTNRRQELARKTSNAHDYIAARELARTLEKSLGRDQAFEIAEAYLGKIALGVDPATALQESLHEAKYPVSAGKGGSRVSDWAYRFTGGFLIILSVGAASIVVHDLRHHGAWGIYTAASAILTAILTGVVGTVSLTCGSADNCRRIFNNFNPYQNWP